ncbi:Cu(I)-responsive transcriptional regulator [Sulfitobacter geojensis]|uniref:Cu(I)-responsive transcriptional regulator n=1 Tax=Sulfitobacter geojensis TaxID=1342299 RepID=A0AAE2VY28_9RHOB|nr:Cu(I)-responsive transcriptional regulator [Sulfitobacter geojensis]MBM1689470.1 Cu(I)-responsive transcriptional regulator [Sulfitobacter geojensis]MBM1693536.1 Cu(I)-responsive transcriptional regulator [Sulfitobacter geojensis]MBM1705702.1 Cu(I)-responsive transcriptional regulator [Sulfitobacter geojensis]MBM1709760.1 Cu(I)-responsive transcriptional regulator [Sulfitobacter geojensis]MBM1713826.1 Cu(I)-responsive transcriptional regulator [Sulfitobacter geojensis]
MNIKSVSIATGLPTKTIRYYEEVGLVRPSRQANGYRVFSENDVHKLVFLARSRSLGFPVESCRSLLALYDDQARASADVKAIAEQHLAEIDQKLAELGAMRETLNTLVRSCAGDNRPDCPILNDLAQEVEG